MQSTQIVTVQSNFKSVEGNFHNVQKCLAPSEDKKMSSDISNYAEYVQTTPGIMQRKATLKKILPYHKGACALIASLYLSLHLQKSLLV